VEGITWWDMSDGGWLNAPAGLIRKDGSSKPAYDELLKRIKGEWWIPPTQLITDANGRIQFYGFLGDYVLTYGQAKMSFSLTRENATGIEIHL
jgi:endo-1,4-beta-xylanase